MEQRQRRPPEDVPEAVKRAYAAGALVPWVGSGLSVQAGFPTYAKLLSLIAEEMAARALCSQATHSRWQGQIANGANLVSVADDIADAMKAHGASAQFELANVLKHIMEKIDRGCVRAPPAHELLAALTCPSVITTNYDRLLERFSFPHHSILTGADHDDLKYYEAHPPEKDSQSAILVKIHGDINRPMTIPFAREEFGTLYGTRQETTPMRDLLRKIFTTKSVLFLGSSLTRTEQYIDLARDILQERGAWGRHYALVAKPPGMERDEEQERQNQLDILKATTNINIIEYVPDEQYSQAWEFIFNIATKTRTNLGDRSWSQHYPNRQRPAYLSEQLRHEAAPDRLVFFTPTLTNVFSTEALVDKAASNANVKGDLDVQIVADIRDRMQKRRTNFYRLVDEGVTQIQALFLMEKLLQDAVTLMNNAAGADLVRKRYEEVVTTIESHRTTLHVRILAKDLPPDDRTMASFGLVCNHVKGTGDARLGMGEVATFYASQATENFFAVHIVDVNNVDAFRRLGLFESYWPEALSEESTLEALRTALTDPATLIAQYEKQKEKPTG